MMDRDLERYAATPPAAMFGWFTFFAVLMVPTTAYRGLVLGGRTGALIGGALGGLGAAGAVLKMTGHP